MLGKILSILTVGSTFASFTLIHRIVEGVTELLALVVITALMCSVLLIGLFFGIYWGLVYYGVSTGIAFTIVGVLVLLITIFLITLTVNKLRALQLLSRHHYNPEFPGISQVCNIADAFLDGFLNKPHTRSKD